MNVLDITKERRMDWDIQKGINPFLNYELRMTNDEGRRKLITSAAFCSLKLRKTTTHWS